MIKGRGVPFALLLVVVVLRPHFAGNTYPFVQGLFLVPLLVGFGLLLLVPGEGRPWPSGTLRVIGLPWVLAVWALVSLFWSPDKGQGLRDVTTLLANVTVFSLTAWLVQTEGGDRDRAYPTVTLVVLPVLFSALYQRFIGFENIRETLLEIKAAGGHVEDLAPIIADDRVFAGFLNPNMLAGFLAITLCLTIDLLITSRTRKRVAVLSVLAAFQVLVLVLTGSLGGTVAAAAALGGVVVLRRGMTVRTAALTGVGLLLTAVGIFSVRGTAFLLGPESSLVQRGGYMAAGIRMAMVRPIFGWGSGSSPGALMGYVSEGVRPVADPHNFVIRAWLEWGVPGAALLLLFMGFWVITVIGSYRGRGFKNLPGGALGLFFGAGAFWLHSLVDMDFFVPETALFGWCAAGAALGMALVCRPQDEMPANRESATPRLIAGAVALTLVMPAFLYLQAESLAFRAGKAMEAGDFGSAVSLYSQAGKLLPLNGRFVLEEGRARLLVGERKKAMELLERAESLLPVSPYPSWELGRLFQETGDWEGSVGYLETALVRYPTSPRIRIDLARAYLNLGKISQALGEMREALRYTVFDPEARSLIERFLADADR